MIMRNANETFTTTTERTSTDQNVLRTLTVAVTLAVSSTLGQGVAEEKNEGVQSKEVAKKENGQGQGKEDAEKKKPKDLWKTKDGPIPLGEEREIEVEIGEGEKKMKKRMIVGHSKEGDILFIDGRKVVIKEKVFETEIKVLSSEKTTQREGAESELTVTGAVASFSGKAVFTKETLAAACALIVSGKDAPIEIIVEGLGRFPGVLTLKKEEKK